MFIQRFEHGFNLVLQCVAVACNSKPKGFKVFNYQDHYTKSVSDHLSTCNTYKVYIFIG